MYLNNMYLLQTDGTVYGNSVRTERTEIRLQGGRRNGRDVSGKGSGKKRNRTQSSWTWDKYKEGGAVEVS